MFNLHNRRLIAQAISRIRQYPGTLNLQTRFLLIMGISTIVFILLGWVLLSHLSRQFIEHIGTDLAEKQMLYDRARTLKQLTLEMERVRHVADSHLIRDWVNSANNPPFNPSVLKQLEELRTQTSSHNFFIALVKSGNFFFGDPAKQGKGPQLSYTLNPADPEDAWFFDFIKSGENQRYTVAGNRKLGVSKIWVSVPIRQDNQVVGVLGTGVDLENFIANNFNPYKSGISNMFISRNGQLQIYADDDHIDFPNIAGYSDEPHSSDLIRDENTGRKWINDAMIKLEYGGQNIATGFVNINDEQFMAAMTYLPEMNWYDLTLINLSLLRPKSQIIEIGLMIFAGILAILLILSLSLHRLVLKPVAALTKAVTHIRKGNSRMAVTENSSSSEVSELATQFNFMADAIYNTQHWLEAEIKSRTHELSEAKELLELSLQKEKFGREIQANLMALMAHEMRSPIAVISNTAQMLNVLAQSGHPDWQPRIEKIRHSVKQLSSLMDNFLTEQWLDMDKYGLNMEPGELNRFCADITLKFVSSHARAIDFETCVGNTRLYADWELLRIAIGNLIDNACRYSPAHEHIFLRILSHDDEFLCIQVSNRGSGISPEIQSRIFEKFSRGEHENSIPGSGLGLYLVNWIARFHGGYTRVESSAGQECTFFLYLPLHRRDSLADSLYGFTGKTATDIQSPH